MFSRPRKGEAVTAGETALTRMGIGYADNSTDLARQSSVVLVVKTDGDGY